jgi:hypothetical protein
MLIRNGVRRRVQAIREGLDDRLLVLIEFDASAVVTAVTAQACGERLCTWRAAYEDELEVVAFLRMGLALEPSGEMNRQRTVAQALQAQGLPVAIGVSTVSTVPPLPTTPKCLEQWAWCEGDRHMPLDAPHTAADLFFTRCDDAVRSQYANEHEHAGSMPLMPRLIVVCEPTASAADQAALCAQMAEDIASGAAVACGLILAPFAEGQAAEPNGTHPLLTLLANAVHGRRITLATRRFAPLRCGL